MAWTWLWDEERYLIVVNLSENAAQARIQVPWKQAENRTWQLDDLISGATYERHGGEMLSPGLYVELDRWGFHFLAAHASP